MKVELALDRTELLVQETMLAALTIENDTSQEVLVPDPRAAHNLIVLRLTNRATGKTAEYTQTSRARKVDPRFDPHIQAVMKRLKGGEKAAAVFNLLSWIEPPPPGKYSLQALVSPPEWTLKSNSVDFEVSPARLGAVQLLAATDPVGHWTCVYTHLEDKQTTDVLVRSWNLKPGVLVNRSLRIGRVKETLRPVGSVMPNGMWPQGYWVAWTAGSRLTYAWADTQRLVLPPKTFDLPKGLETTLLRPLLHPLVPAGGPAEGYALVHCLNPAGARATLLALTLSSTGKVTPQRELPLAEADAPAWSQVFYQSSGERRPFWMAASAEGFRLNTLDWPKDAAPANPRTLARWGGRFVDAAAQIAEDDTIHGVVLAWLPAAKDKPGRLAWIRWKMAAGTFSQGDPIPVAWPADSAVVSSSLAVARSGAALALLRAASGKWTILDHEGAAAPGPAELMLAERADILFVDAHVTAIRYPDATGTYHYLRGDGQPYPTW